MALTLTKTLNISLADSLYDGDTGTGAAILQVSKSYPVGVGNPILQMFRGPTVTVPINSSGLVFFPAIGPLASGARITIEFEVAYGAGDVTAVNRLLTWTRDSVVVETDADTGSFSFDTSLTLARVGTETCYITPTYIVRA